MYDRHMTTRSRTLERVPKSNKPPMIQRTYRVPEKLYAAAMATAAENEEDLSDVIRRALTVYVAIEREVGK